MRRLVAVVALCTLLAPWVARATAVVDELPVWHMTGDEACYGFEDAKKLLLANYRLRECRKTDAAYASCLLGNKALQDEMIARTTLENELNRQLSLQATAIKDLQAQNGRYKYLLVGVGAGALIAGILAGVYVAR